MIALCGSDYYQHRGDCQTIGRWPDLYILIGTLKIANLFIATHLKLDEKKACHFDQLDQIISIQMIIGAEVVVQQLADGLICIQLDKNDWTAEDKHLGGKTDATIALITASQIAPL